MDIHEARLRLGIAAMLFAGGALAQSTASKPLQSNVPGDVTAKVEDLGIPNEKHYPSGDLVYARNPWSLKAFQGRIYVGGGNSNNKGPAPNAGPVDVIAFDPKTGKFRAEWTVPDEQIDEFRVIGGTLVIPGHDPRQSWAYGNFYMLPPGGGWQKVRTIKGGIHMYDVIRKSAPSGSGSLTSVDTAAFSKPLMYAALGTPIGAVVGVSADFGKSWDEHPMLGTYRARTFLYGRSDMCVSTSGSKAYLVKPDGVSRLDVNLFPGTPNATANLFAAKPERFQGSVYYLGAYAPIDHNWIPVAMYATPDCHQVRPVKIPAGTPRDLRVYNGVLYVLASQPEGGNQRIHLYSTRDGASFTDVLSFAAGTFARSFEILDGDAYFGLGSEADALQHDTGRILRIKGAVPR